VKGALQGQVILGPDESTMRQPEAVINVAFQRDTTRASLGPYRFMNKDAIIADRRRVLDDISVVLPRRQEGGEEAHDLLAPVARPRLGERAMRVVVAVGLPELVDQGFDGTGSGFPSSAISM
jgi:hypothetical protein